MKYLLANLGVNLVAIACIAVAGYMAVNNKSGWEWFLAAGLMCAATVSLKTEKE